MDNNDVGGQELPLLSDSLDSASSCLLDIAQNFPFYEQNDDQLQNELWVGGGRKWDIRPLYWPKGRDRGNYVKSYIFKNLRIEAKSTRPRVTWNLEALWAYFPNELISSIFGLLHPIDLYHAIQTSKTLRRFLLDRNSISIWKESFENHPEIPFYPDYVSAPKWASLIFGPATCDFCGRDNSLIEYALLSRRCNECMDYHDQGSEQIVTAIRPILGEFPEKMADIWRLALKTYRLSPVYYSPSLSEGNLVHPRYSISQIVEVAQVMREFLSMNRMASLDLNLSEYDVFIEFTAISMQECLKHASLCNDWAFDIYMQHGKRYMASITSFCEGAEREVRKQNHDERDLKPALSRFEGLIISGWPIMTDCKLDGSNLKKFLPMLEAMVNKEKEERLRKQRINCIAARQGKVGGFYYDTVKKFHGYRELCCVPHPKTVYSIKFFADYINDPLDTFVELDENLAQREVRRFVTEYISAKKRRLLNLLVESGVIPEATETSKPDNFLGTATAVFECCGRSHVGWEEAGVHICRLESGLALMQDARDDTFVFRFSKPGYQALQNLARLLRLESLESVSPKDLDNLNKRFICKTSKLVQKAGVYCLPSLTWRECIDHAITAQNSEEGQHAVEFDILSEASIANLLAFERPFPVPSDRYWCCNRCRTYFEPLTKNDAIIHAYQVHGVFRATVGVDFDYFHSENKPVRSPIFIGLDDNANHRCLRCPRSPKLWLKKDPDLYQHLSDRHHIVIKDLREGVDWEKVPVVEDNGWIRQRLRLQEELAS
ncbi:hypothetical protein BDN70DRAFT_870247 [Pholiota conissans]|uniref:F-box domain-containing protein n=1 Tax=Pholiota conissans TaxID=109636 RepID=A0A9P5ZDP7_9AGAR|nr:hypothetical protein BDN70DRAFT_870247 [Pholiota conissans]